MTQPGPHTTAAPLGGDFPQRGSIAPERPRFYRWDMELHRGRLFDHVHLVVKDREASKRFYRAILQALEIPVGAEAADHFWADELFISSAQSRAARGELTGRVHLALQAKSRERVEEFHRVGLAAGGPDNGAAPPSARPARSS